MQDPIYFDFNATTPVKPDVSKVMQEIAHQPLNASAVHSYGRKAKQLLEKARRQVCDLIHADPSLLIFNSGATEGNNTVLKYFQGPILISSMEHLSVLEARQDAIFIKAHENGTPDLNHLENLLQDHKPELVSCMLVNNETGIIQPISKISKLVKRYGALLHVDAVQAPGRIPVNMQELGIDFLTLSAHKLGGPQGVGALAIGFCGITPALLHGGGQERQARAGTENLASIIGFGHAAELARSGLEQYQELGQLRDHLEQKIAEITPQAKFYGQDGDRVPNTSMFSLSGTTSEALMMALDLEGFAVSNGSACSSGTVHASHVLKAMGASDEEASSAIRISLGWNTKKDEIEQFLEAWQNITQRLTT